MRALSVLLLAWASGCAPQPAPEPGLQLAAQGSATGRQCFNADMVNGFQAVGDRAIDLNVTRTEVYRVETFGPCPDLENAVGLGVRTRTGGSFVCSDLDVELVVPSTVGAPRTCLVRSLRRLTPAEIEGGKRGG